MKISEYIAELQKLQSEHGDLEVETRSPDGRRIDAFGPTIAYERILRGRENKPMFFYPWDEEDRRGNKVLSI